MEMAFSKAWLNLIIIHILFYFNIEISFASIVYYLKNYIL